ncbi:zf-HC2 domain-containing protein [Actinocorallia lasiicapitis]
MSYEIEHTDVAAYALGVLNEQDRRVFEAHLSGCRFCTMELADLGGMGRLLTGVEPPPASTIASIPARQSRRKGVARNWLTSVAAGFVLILGGVTGGVALSANDRVPGIDMSKGVQFTAADTATGVRGTAVLDRRSWGTWIALDMDGVRGGPFDCELVVIAKNGDERVASGWAVPADPEHLRVEGGVADQLGELDRLEVRSDNGTVLLTFPVRT